MSRSKAVAFALLLVVLGTGAPAVADEQGTIDVRWTAPLEVLQGAGRKLYSGEVLTLSLSGGFTQHDTRRETHCAVLGMFCDDVDVPNPHDYSPATVPVQIDFLAEGTGTPFQTVTLGAAAVTITIPGTIDFSTPVHLRAMILHGGNRSISSGRYTLQVAINSAGRLSSFVAYLGAASRNEAQLRSQDVINDRLRDCCASQVALAVANHADSRFSGDSAARLALLQFAVSIDPQNAQVLDRLASFLIQSGDFQGSMTVARQALNAATDDAQRSLAYIRLGTATEQEWAGLNKGSLQAAAMYYYRARTTATASGFRPAELTALVESARVLKKMRTRESLAQSVALLEQARQRAPTELPGFWDDVAPDGSSILTMQVVSGFTLSGDTNRIYSGDNESWIPLSTDPDRQKLLIQDENGVGWWDPAHGFQQLSPILFHEASAGMGGVLGVSLTNGIEFIPASGSARLVQALNPPAPSTASGPNLPSTVDYAIAANAPLLAWVANEQQIHVEQLDGTSVSTIAIGGGDSILQIALAPDGRRVAAAVLANGYVEVRIWDAASPSTPTVLRNAAGTMHPFIFARPGLRAMSFSPDGTVLLVTDSKVALLASAATGIVQQNIQSPLGPTPWPFTIAAGHSWLDNHRVLIFTSSVPQLVGELDTNTGQISMKQLSIATAWLGRRSLTFTGALILSLSGQEQVVSLASHNRAFVWSAATAAKIGEIPFDTTGVGASVKLTTGGRYFIVPSPGNVRVFDAQTGSQSNIVAAVTPSMTTPPFPVVVAGRDPSHWNLVESDTNGFSAIRHFVGTAETGRFSVPQIDSSVAAIFAVGGACPPPPPPPQGTIPPFHASWTMGPEWTSLVPTGWQNLVPPYPGVHNNPFDLPEIDLTGGLPQSTSIRKVITCSMMIARRPSDNSSIVELFSPPSTYRLSWVTGAATPIDLYNEQYPAGPPAFYIHFGQNSVVATNYNAPPNSADVRIWRLDSSAAVPIPCGACVHIDASSLRAYAQNLYGSPLTPVLLASATNKTLLVPRGDQLQVIDVAQNSIRFRLTTRFPVFLSDSSVFTMSKDQRLRMWKF